MIQKLISTLIISTFLFIPFAASAKNLFAGLVQRQLDNGLTVLLLRDTAKPIVSVQIWVKAGVWNETPETNGLSHFVEHMLFKGTSTRPVNAIQQAVESKGGMINGATSKDFTYYYINVPGTYWDNALTILADMVQNASFDAKELAKERLVVLEEIQRQNDEPSSFLWNKFNETIFKQLPYRMTTLGTVDNLKSFTREMMQKYYQANYQPATMTVIISGDFPQDKALSRIKELFPQAKTAPPVIKQSPPVTVESAEDPFPVKSEVPFQVNLVYHLIGFLGPTIESQDQYALDVLATMLGVGRSSRLNQSLREDQQLVFNISANFLSQKANGIFIINAIYQPNRIPEATNAIMGEIRRFSLAEVSDAELVKAKRMLKASFILDNQTYADQANTLGYYATVTTVEPALKYMNEIENVSQGDISRVAKKYLGQNYTSILLTPGVAQSK
ncbi:MAG: insulinase family protein [Elusimicrobia bacterium]|nr:insulinase family protein [Elusimicrobiota bacterium]